MLNSGKKFRALRDKKSKYSNSCVVRKKKFWTKHKTITPPLQVKWSVPKKYTGYLHYRLITTGSRFLWIPCCSYMCFFLVLVCPCQLFVRLWYRVSDVLDLSLVSKRFGFWPHITHVIVLTFKEIKHLSDYRTIGL
jgi:hypothetical protein